jgi:hypothetical protein
LEDAKPPFGDEPASDASMDSDMGKGKQRKTQDMENVLLCLVHS